MKTATFETSRGTIVAELFDDETPGTVANFEKLANDKFYDGTRFHRVIPNFMIEAGDPHSRNENDPRAGTGGPGYTIKCETHKNTHKHLTGTLSMAHAGKDTGGSQFFIVNGDRRNVQHLDGVHTVFGKCVGPDDIKIVQAIKADDKILKATITEA
jgi:peptidyl-prolyl cis-trans isomerase B (cyclophilin B)